MELPKTHYVEVDGAYVAYHVIGSGPLDLLVLGSQSLPLMAITEPLLAPFFDRLASFSRVIRFDRRGSGLSDPIPGGAEWTLEHWADDALAVLDAVGSFTCAVLAAQGSMGAAAILLAAGYPGRVSALVLGNPAPCVRAAPDFPWGMPPDEADHLADRLTDRMIAGESTTYNWTPEINDWFFRMRSQFAAPASYRLSIRAFVDVDVRAFLSDVQAPTLVLQRGGLPFLFGSPDHGRYVADHIPNSRYIELPGDIPFIYFDDPKPLLDEIEEFLTGVRPVPESDRVLATVLMTDIVESTTRTASVGDRAWRDLLDRHDAIVRAELDRHRGKKVNSIGLGDGVLATFDGPARGCRCAAALHESIRSSLGIDIRAGLHTGEVELRGDDVTGMAVNIAARVMGLANANETLVSRTVTDLVAGSGLEFEERGEQELKGVPGKWAIYAVRS